MAVVLPRVGTAEVEGQPPGRAMRADILSWSRSRGAFGGISLQGSTLREDSEPNEQLYGKEIKNEPVLTGKATAPPRPKNLPRPNQPFCKT